MEKLLLFAEEKERKLFALEECHSKGAWLSVHMEKFRGDILEQRQLASGFENFVAMLDINGNASATLRRVRYFSGSISGR
jgi:hypothetical protein